MTVEARNLETNFGRTLVTEADGRFVFLQLPPGQLPVTFTLAGFATLVQENVVADGRPGDHAAGRDDGVRRVAETVTVTRRRAVDRNHAHRPPRPR